MSALEELDERIDQVGELGKSDAKTSLWRMVAAHMKEKRMRVTELFSMIDKDKNKGVSKGELFEFLKTIGVEADKEDLKEAFTFDGKLEKELNLSQLKAEVSRFSRDLADISAVRPKSPVRSRSPAKTSGYGQSTAASMARVKSAPSAGTAGVPLNTRVASASSSAKSTGTKTATGSSRATGSTQASASRSVNKSPSKSRPGGNTVSKDKSPNKTRPVKSTSSSGLANSKSAPKAAGSSGMDALSALADASSNSADDAPLVSAGGGAKRRPSDSEMGVSLVMEDWEEQAKKKKEGVVIAFDRVGEHAAELLHDDLIDLKVNMKPLKKATGDKKENFDEYKAILKSAVLLVVLRTSTYGKEPKNAVEIATLKGGETSILVLDLCGDNETSHLSSVLKEGDLASNQVYRTPGGWDPKEEDLPQGMSAHVVNYMIAEQSKSASYNDDPETKFAATSNAKPRRLSMIDLESLGKDDEEDESNAKPSPPAPEIVADEETFQRFQQEEAEEEEGVEDQMGAAFQRFQMEQEGDS